MNPQTVRYKITDPTGKVIYLNTEEKSSLGVALAAIALGDIKKITQWAANPDHTLTKRESVPGAFVPEINAFIKAAIRMQTLASIISSGIVTREHLQPEINRSSTAMWERMADLQKAYPEYCESLHEPIFDVGGAK